MDKVAKIITLQPFRHQTKRKKKKKTFKDGKKEKCVCVLGNLEQAIDFKEQKRGKEIIRKNRKTQMCAFVCALIYRS